MAATDDAGFGDFGDAAAATGDAGFGDFGEPAAIFGIVVFTIHVSGC